jgi:glycosyltransferase involved in cell wall biosynthesis
LTLIMVKPADAVTIVVPVRNAAGRLASIPAYGEVVGKLGRAVEILVVDDGSIDGTLAAAEQLANRHPYLRVLRHETPRGYGACIRTALSETTHPLFFYTALDYPYTPGNLRLLLERIDVRDDILGKQPDLISGCRTGLPTPAVVKWLGRGWRLFWRIFAGMPIQEPPPWHGWREFCYRLKAKWIYGVPLADVNSCFKLFRTAFLKRFPIQSNGDLVHTELVAKATFLTSIMDEVLLTPKPDPLPRVTLDRDDYHRLSGTRVLFAFPTRRETTPEDLDPSPTTTPTLTPVL